MEEKETFMSQVRLYRMKVSSLFTTQAMIILKTSHPLKLNIMVRSKSLETQMIEPIILDKLSEVSDDEWMMKIMNLLSMISLLCSG
jgi:hypothetical protein